jgi:hypothetical protein
MHPVIAQGLGSRIGAVSPVVLTRSGRVVALGAPSRSQSRGRNDQAVNDLELRSVGRWRGNGDLGAGGIVQTFEPTPSVVLLVAAVPIRG